MVILDGGIRPPLQQEGDDAVVSIPRSEVQRRLQEKDKSVKHQRKHAMRNDVYVLNSSK